MGIYDCGLSIHEQNKRGMRVDHCGAGQIDQKKPVEKVVEEVEAMEVVFGIADEEGYLAFDGKTWKTKKGVEAAFEKVDEGVGYFIVEVPVEK